MLQEVVWGPASGSLTMSYMSALSTSFFKSFLSFFFKSKSMHTAMSKGAGSQGAWPWPRPFLAGPRDEGCLPRPALQAHAASENRHPPQPSKPPAGRQACGPGGEAWPGRGQVLTGESPVGSPPRPSIRAPLRVAKPPRRHPQRVLCSDEQE